MTCIVGIKENQSVYIGGDSASLTGYQITIRKDPKVIRNGDFLIGYTTSFRMGQLLAYKLIPPPKDPKQDIYEFMVCSFAETVRSCLKEGGFSKIEGNQERGGVFLIGYQGKLFTMHDDFQIEESIDEYASCGYGATHALGCLYGNKDLKLEPEKRIIQALEAAAKFNCAVAPPFQIKSICSSVPQNELI